MEQFWQKQCACSTLFQSYKTIEVISGQEEMGDPFWKVLYVTNSNLITIQYQKVAAFLEFS